jgi:hypothetical protein
MYIDEMEDASGWNREFRSEEAQERKIQLNALCRVYEQADRVLSGDPVIVNVVEDGPAPAWSDGQSITVNASYINEMDIETLTQINGLNYHELAHHLYTPRKGTTMIQYVLENNLMTAFNILEDQRIETLLVARYPSIAPFLTATCARWLAEDEDEAIGNYLCVRGRRYLPVEIRQGFRDVFAFPELIPNIIDIVDQYRILAFPRDYEYAKTLIKRLQDEVLIPMGLMVNQKTGGPNGCGDRAPIAKGRPEPGKAQERDAKNAGGMGTKESPFIPKQKQQPQSQPQAEEGQGGNNSTPYIPKNSDEAIAIRDHKVDGEKSFTPGQGHVDSQGGISTKLNDMLNDAIDDVLTNKDVIADVKAKQRVIVGGDGKYDDVLKRGKFDMTTVPEDTVIAYRKFAKELQRLRDDMEPTWHRGMPTGRLNVQRVIKGCEIDEAFDRWDEGDDGCDIEAVILVDRSGSMTSNQNDKSASLACWTIKRALEHINSFVTVYAFDDKPELAYNRSEPANKTQYKFIYGDGGTDPYSSLLAAEQLLMSSRRKNKMLFVITDGVFSSDKNDELIERISKRGVLTVMTLIMSDSEFKWYTNGHGTEETLRHKSEIFGRITSAKDLLPFARSIVTSAIRKRVRR